jgi:molybdenum cofactor biosynthesis protein B
MNTKRAQTRHASDAGKCYRAAVISISTSRFERYGSAKAPDEAEDVSGKIIIELLTKAGYKLRGYTLVSDERGAITEAIKAHINDADAIITTGGTGLAPRDLTIETVQQMIQKEIPGFGELFRHLSYEEIGSSAMLSRASGGIIEKTAVFCLPGSPNAVRLAMEALILPQLPHIMLHACEK